MIMKKIVSIIAILALMLSLFACADAGQTATAGGTAGTAEEDIIVTATEAQVAEWRALTDKRIAEIENTPNMEIPAGATVYYISNNGDDDNDGLTPETAWASLRMVNGSKITEGCYVLFERGGLWRGPITLHDGVTYSAYGEGEKPRLYASLFNGADPELWEETEVPNVWKVKIGKDYDVIDVGFVICDGRLGAKVIQNFNIDGTPVDRVSGYPFASYADLRNDLQFVYSVEGKRNIGYVYMYSEGNPGDRFGDIEFGVTVNIMFAETLRDATVDNIAFAYCGAHGFGIGPGTNVTVKNCTFRWIGGGMSADEDSRAVYSRYGNAVEIYGGCDGYYVDNNYLYQIYDTGITCQYNMRHDEDQCFMLNTEYTNNVIEYCNSPFEHFLMLLSNKDTPQYESMIDGLLIENNIAWYSGKGLCEQRPVYSGQVMASGQHTRIDNITVKGNLFLDSTCEIYGTVGMIDNKDGSPSVPTFIDNTFVNYKELFFGRITHENDNWLVEQAYDSSIPDAMVDGSSGNKFYAFPDSKEPTKQVEPDYEIVKFGKYEQDNNTENGKEDIEWYVADRDGDYALLVSRYIIDKAPVSYAKNSYRVWEISPVREWLNGAFIEESFTAEEAALIRTTHVIMDQNPDYPSDSGNDTDDKVFYLSLTELLKYFPTAESRICKATTYANKRGVTILSSTHAADYSLRTIGIIQERSVAVGPYGSIKTRGDFPIHRNDNTVRPAMWVKIGK